MAHSDKAAGGSAADKSANTSGYGKMRKNANKMERDEKTLAMAPGAGLDFGSIAKGRAADKLAAYLQEQGVETALIDLGGNIRAIGERTYTIGLQGSAGFAADFCNDSSEKQKRGNKR